MINLFFCVNIVFILILILFFSKTISISKGSIVKVNYTKSGLISKAIGYFVFASFIIYLFYISSSYNGWLLLISLPFTALVLSPFLGIIKKIKNTEILSYNTLLNTITIEGVVYRISDISKIQIVYRIGQNPNGTNDYVFSLFTNENNEIPLLVLPYREDAILIIDELNKLLKLPIECFQDGGLLGIKKISKESL